MKIILSHFILFILFCSCKISVAQITGSFSPIELEQAVKVKDAIYTLNIIEAKTHGYTHKGNEYVCSIEYSAEIVDALKGNSSVGEVIKFAAEFPLTIRTRYLVFLDDLSKPVELPKGVKYIPNQKPGAYKLHPAYTDEGQVCEKGLPLLRVQLERSIFEFDKDLEFKTKEPWLRYIPVRASVVLPESVKQVLIAKKCGEPLEKECLFNEVAIRWNELCASIKELMKR